MHERFRRVVDRGLWLSRGDSETPEAGAGTVAYLLKGYPRLSEIFIASEIHRLERAGVCESAST